MVKDNPCGPRDDAMYRSVWGRRQQIITRCVQLVVLLVLSTEACLAALDYHNRNNNRHWSSLQAVIEYQQQRCSYGYGTTCRYAYHVWANPEVEDCGTHNDPCWYQIYQRRAADDVVLSYGEVFVAGAQSCAAVPGFDRDTGVCAGSAKHPPACPAEGNPINVATSNKHQREPDYRSPVPGGLVFTRYYSSQSTYAAPSPLGAHWRHTYRRSLSVRVLDDGTTRVVAQRADGRRLRFWFDQGVWRADPDVLETLQPLEDGSGWRLTTADDTVEHYDARGRLQSLTDRAGRPQRLAYDTQDRLETVTGPFGRMLRLAYDAQGRLESLTDPAGGIYRYGYDANDNLTAVRYPDETPTDDTDNPTRVYHYEDPDFAHALTGITDANGDRFATYGYDEHGRAILSAHAGGAERVQLTYHDDGSTTVTDALGAVRTYRFDTVHGVVKPVAIDGDLCSTCGTQAQRSTTYDTNGFIDSETDANGNRTTYRHNDRGLQTARTEAVGTAEERSIVTAWHDDFRLPTRISAPGTVTAFAYNASGRLERRTARDIATGRERSWHYAYTPEGLLASVDGPRTDVEDMTTYAYDAQGNRIRSTNALGQVTAIPVYDAHGRPLELLDPNGVRTTLTYDPRGRLRSRTVGAGLDAATTGFDYDAVGNLKRITLPDGGYLDYAYDAAHRLTAVEDSLGNRIAYTLNEQGQRTQQRVLDPDVILTHTQQQVYDTLGRLRKTIGAYGHETSYGYDANGNRIATTDALNRTTTAAFDALDRLIRQTDADGGETRYGYDANDRLTAVTDPRGLTTAYRYDGLGNRIAQHSPDTGTTTYTFDARGNRLSQTDARGISTRYTFDALNRLETVRYPDSGLDVRFTYDEGPYGSGRLTGMMDSSGSTTYRYDPRGNLASATVTILGVDYTTGYRYDVADRLTRLTYPSGRTLDYARDAAGQVIMVTTTDTHGNTQTVASDMTYFPFGPIEALGFGNGLRTTRRYDLNARLSEQTTAALQALGWEYDAVGNVTDITDTIDPNNTRRYAYDDLDRLTAESGVYGRRAYAYDALGNRTRRLKVDTPSEDTTLPKTRTQTYTYADGSNRLTHINRKALSFDAAGNTRSDRGGKRRYTYDDSNRLARFSKNETLKASYRYNGHGERVIKRQHTAQGERTSVYHYAPHGRLIAETRYNTHGVKTTAREYLWLDDRPLAQITTRYTPSGTVKATQTVYLHTDHLNTPRLATDQHQRVVWRWDADAFGQGKADRDPDGDGHRVTLPLRFPGQYKDPESGLHYNYFK